jgi:hypothetical protein
MATDGSNNSIVSIVIIIIFLNDYYTEFTVCHTLTYTTHLKPSQPCPHPIKHPKTCVSPETPCVCSTDTRTAAYTCTKYGKVNIHESSSRDSAPQFSGSKKRFARIEMHDAHLTGCVIHWLLLTEPSDNLHRRFRILIPGFRRMLFNNIAVDI